MSYRPIETQVYHQAVCRTCSWKSEEATQIVDPITAAYAHIEEDGNYSHQIEITGKMMVGR